MNERVVVGAPARAETLLINEAGGLFNNSVRRAEGDGRTASEKFLKASMFYLISDSMRCIID